ncbi:MAG: mandelate racemase [Solibacterales bacterium]|nr:mandelate racemase [Bryobacterales bacterium]
MKISRRTLISRAMLAGGATAIPSVLFGKFQGDPNAAITDYSALDRVLRMPVLKRELFSEPVIIDALELLQDRNNFICRVRSRDGAEGISIGHPFISKAGYPMFKDRVRPRFLGKDARDLDQLVFDASERNVKRQGIPLCVQIATAEFAILDMLGSIAEKPVGQLIGEIHHPEIAVYQGTRLRELRREDPEVSLALVQQDLEETKAKAVKLRAGRGDNLGSDIDNAPGRTEKLIRMARRMFGDDKVLMIDGNGSYSVKEAIRIGRILEENNYYFYEEPVPWDWYQEQKQVADAMTIPMAGGEEEFGMHAFRWLIASNAFDIIQPDQFYFGGIIRSMQVARMAQAGGKTIVPHLSAGGLGYLYLLHYVSACPNAGEYHEFKLFATKDANGTAVPIESKTEPFVSVDGVIKVPTGPGLGVHIDPDYIKTHKLIYG